MRWLRRVGLLVVVGILAAAAPLAAPNPPKAKAASLPTFAISPASAIGGTIGIGNPVGDAIGAVTDPILGLVGDKLKDVAGDIGKGVFNRVTAWIADGAVWLVGEVAALSDKTTSPNLLGKGFLKQYRLMAQIAMFLAALMVLLAVFDSLGKGDPMMILRVLFVNVPLAALATSIAFVVVQLLIATCDGMCEAIASSTGADSRVFFKGAITAIAAIGGTSGAAAGAAVGGPVGAAAGTVAVPLFIGFIAAVVVAFAAFFVWMELLMRDAAIYVTAAFMPLAIGAAIWPRWNTVLKRTCELQIVLIFSKFVIVATIALAASLLAENEGSVQYVLAAAAMLLIACFAPFYLYKLMPIAEGAIVTATSRQSAGRTATSTVQNVNSMQMMQRMSRANWAASGGGEKDGRGSSKATGSKGGAGEGGSGGAAAGAEGAAAGAGAAGAVPVAAAVGAAKGTKAAAEQLSQTGEAQVIGGETAVGSKGAERGREPSTSTGRESPTRPASAGGEPTDAREGSASTPPRPDGAVMGPKSARGGKASPAGASAPRPSTAKGGGSPGEGLA